MTMIMLTRLTGEKLLVNSNQIETVEQSHDTRITLVSGRQLFVSETAEMIADLATARPGPGSHPQGG